MHAATRQRIDTILDNREAAQRHAATVQRQLQEDRQKRHHQQQLRAVRTLSLSGFIRR